MILRTAYGKAEPFRKECGGAADRKECGGAARKTLLKKQELVRLCHRLRRLELPQRTLTFSS